MDETRRLKPLAKSPTGIEGLDVITYGGLPAGRPTLVAGRAGSGKTLFAMEFLVRGATEFNENGVFMAFEESAEDVTRNVVSLGFDLEALVAQKKLVVDHVQIDRAEVEATGEYDLDGLFIRLGYAIDSIGAKRVVLDTLETLFSTLPNEFILRSELQRLFRWLKEKGVTAIITAERGETSLTRQGLEEYVSDCVIVLDHRLIDQISTRRLRIVKYRGSAHGTNEYPFLIDEQGFYVLPITSLGLEYPVSNERISTGIPQLDEMLGGKGYFRGSSILVSGTAGTGKSSIAAQFADAACRRGERCLYFAFEEPMSQIVRNMRSIGLDLQQWVDSGLLMFSAARPTAHGSEMHLAAMSRQIQQYKPQMVIVDPITNLTAIGAQPEAKAMLMGLVDVLKAQGITSLFTSLVSGGGGSIEQVDSGIASLIDTWLLIRGIELNGERNRAINVLKSRSMYHSNQTREFLLTDQGIALVDVYRGSAGMLTGSARVAQEVRERADEVMRQQELAQRKAELEQSKAALEAKIAVLRADLNIEALALDTLEFEEKLREESLVEERSALAFSRRITPVQTVPEPEAPTKANGKQP